MSYDIFPGFNHQNILTELSYNLTGSDSSWLFIFFVKKIWKYHGPSVTFFLHEFTSNEFTASIVCRGPFYFNGSTLIPAWISSCLHHELWDEITYPFPNFSATDEVCEWISNFIPHFNWHVVTYPCPCFKLGWKLIQESKGALVS